MVSVMRLNHAVLYVRELDRSVTFYQKAFGFEEVARSGETMAFLRAGGSSNHHDLGLMAVGRQAPQPPPGSTGLCYLAWELPTIESLAEASTLLQEMGALVGASDHGVTKSLYAVDPDGNEFEMMWLVPREQWGTFEHEASATPLDLDRELLRFGSLTARATT